MGYNQYLTHETMAFDNTNNGGSVLDEKAMDLMLGRNGEEKLSAHS